jgi:CubicO group peptidase (beta-lactamase class C family)
VSVEGTKTILQEAIVRGDIPSAVAVIGRSKKRELVIAEGVEHYGGQAVHRETLYDIASLTKVVSTLPLILKLVSDNELSFEHTVGKFFSNAGWGQTPTLADVRVRDLLTHSSGLPAWKPLFAWVSERSTAIANVLQTSPVHPGQFAYSDLGFILLGAILERITGQHLDILATELFKRLEMPHTSYHPISKITYGKTVTKQVSRPELVEGQTTLLNQDIMTMKHSTLKQSSTSIAATEDCGWRGRLLVGEVHDENAFIMDGVAGHAGLFASVDDLATYAQAWLNLDSRLASEDVLHEAIQLHLEQDGHRRALGWMLKGENSFAGTQASLQGFGHTGFTGTSIWIEPHAPQPWFAVLLTNRVHPTRQHGQNIHTIRQAFHNAAKVFL